MKKINYEMAHSKLKITDSLNNEKVMKIQFTNGFYYFLNYNYFGNQSYEDILK